MLTCSVCGLMCADILVGLLRLRKCSEDTFRSELKDGVSVVRELHVYGSVVPVNARDPSKFQHQVSCIDVYKCVWKFLCIVWYTRREKLTANNCIEQ